MNMESRNRLEQNLKVMSEEMLDLDKIRSEVESKGSTGMSEWLQKVENVEGEVNEIWIDLDDVQRSHDPNNMIARRMLNQKAIKLIKAVKTLKEEGNAIPGSVEDLVNSLLRNQLKKYSLMHLETYTSKFSSRNKIGAGGYGEVFKGQFPGGQVVAVKVLTEKDVDGKVFMTELNTMANAHHVNLIKLLGFCSEGSRKALVYEYMENGSLDTILYAKQHNIEWKKLFEIAIGTAEAIAYLHGGFEEPILHFDIKPANVLLDKNWSPKVTDFGLAKLWNTNVSHVSMSKIRGTEGFTAPEISTPYYPVTDRSDVFSFGMMLFEILGRRSNGIGLTWFPRKVWEMFHTRGVEAVLTECNIEDGDRKNATLLLKVALHCVQFVPTIRPSMSNVVKMLENLIPVGMPQNPFFPSIDSSQGVAGPGSLPEKELTHREDVSKLEQSFKSLSFDLPVKSDPVEVVKHSYSFASSSNTPASTPQTGLTKHYKNVPVSQKARNSYSRKPTTLIMSFEQKFTPRDYDDSVILYTTSLGMVTKSLYECNDIRLMLEVHQVKFSERDLWLHDPYKKELRDILGYVEVPALFVKGRFIGGAKTLKELQEEGQLRILFDEIVRDNQPVTPVPITICHTCTQPVPHTCTQPVPPAPVLNLCHLHTHTNRMHDIIPKNGSSQPVGGVSMNTGLINIPKLRVDKSSMGQTKNWASIIDTSEGSELEDSDPDYDDESGSEDMEEDAHCGSSPSLVHDYQLDAAKEQEEIEAFLSLGKVLGLGVDSRTEDLVELWCQTHEKATVSKQEAHEDNRSRQGCSVCGDSSPSHVF